MSAGESPPRIPGKLTFPGAPVGSISRPLLVARLSGDERVVVIVAPPGYGKTEVARQWVEARRDTVAWLAVDLLDDAPAVFWSDFMRALRRVIPGIDDEPALLLAERGPANPVFLDALIAQVERIDERAAIVIDDIWRVSHAAVFDSLALLVARIGHLVRFVIISRSDPPLPTASWRSRRWITEIREEHLRFSDDEAMRVAEGVADLAVSEQAVAALNARAEGWPIGLHLALFSLATGPEPESKAHAIAGSDRLLIDYLVTEVIDRLPARLRDVALALSVVDWFDSAMCADLLGVDAVGAADELRRRHFFLTTIDGATGAVRFHRLFRELLEIELRWRDPARRVTLHRRAAELWEQRGDLGAAYRHLVAIGDVSAAADMVLQLTLDLIDHGDVPTLAGHMRSLPRAVRVNEAAQAFDLSLAWLFAGDPDETTRWCTAAEELIDPADPAQRLRVHSTWAVVNMMQGSIADASAHVAGFVRLLDEVDPVGPVEVRFATIGTRVALLSRRFDDVPAWLDEAGAIADPEAVARVIVPALGAWYELEAGDLRRARTLADGVCRRVERLGLRPHHGAFDALVVAAHCRLAMGQFGEAEELLEMARSDAATLGWPLPMVRAGLLTVELARLRTGPRSALAAVEALRDTVETRYGDELDGWLAAAEAAALIGCGSFRSAAASIERTKDGARTSLLRARLALASRSGEPVAVLLSERSAWTVAERLEAEMLLSTAHAPGERDEDLVSALTLGHETGWVSPFVGLGDEAEERLDLLPIDELHPALASARHPDREPTGDARRSEALVEPLTPRELTLLELLPTHYSYAQIGDRLFLSVNTIKSNLKSVYRKLAVTSRADAVEVASELGLLSPVSPAASPSAARTRRR